MTNRHANTPPADPPAPDQRAVAGQYRPSDHEPRVWDAWCSAGAFHADPDRVLSGAARPYCIVIPPPNVTDRLHLGHALNNTLQDILCRWRRMAGDETLWMPGTDHAGIATQAVVERRLLKEEGKHRQSYTRDEFVARVQAFKDEYEATITGQLQAMGCSCDWERQRFTMDEQCARAVREAFFILFRDGLIFRGKRLVNWDPALRTAVADDEVEDVEIEGQFYDLRYPLMHPWRGDDEPTPVTWGELLARGYPAPPGASDPATAADYEDNKPAWVTVATTRPETYLGDVAVAINPRDPRARALDDLCVELPLVGRVIPIIEDDYVVMPAWAAGGESSDPKALLATGFLKVTPAHDANDHEIWLRHRREIHHGPINVMAPDASISDRHGWTDVGDAHLFVGLSREEARKKVVAEFRARTVGNGTALLFGGSRPYRHSVKHSDRSKAAIEPYLSDQWFVRVTDPALAASANAALAADQRTSCPPSASPCSLPSSSSSSSSTSSSTSSSCDLGVPPGSSDASAARGPGVPPGSSDASAARGPGVPPGRATPRIREPLVIGGQLTITSRNLPHWQLGGSTYFVTFRIARGELSPAERTLVLSACRHWDGDRMELHAAVVMPDHVHLVMSPFEQAPGRWWSLQDLLHSIKSFTAHAVMAGRSARGGLWQDESFDRIIRPGEYGDTLAYVLSNPVEARLAERWDQYPHSWTTEEARGGRLRFPERVRGHGAEHHPDPEAGPAVHGHSAGTTLKSHRRDACATESAEPHRREASDTGPEGEPASPSGDGSLRFHPARYARTFELWHDNIRDWCISRQLWWGHRIPVWRRAAGSVGASHWLVELRPHEPAAVRPEFRDAAAVQAVRDEAAGDATLHVCIAPGHTDLERRLEAEGWARDEDVLDTWFSSALWPMSTMGWPDRTALLRAFNPTSTLCTAREIITLWVSRMVMFNRYFMPEGGASADGPAGRGGGAVPFRDVFIHALLMDDQGRKMSKSLGNGVDPLDIIATHGADALRFTLCHLTTHTQDIRMPVVRDERTGRNSSPKFDPGRNLCNKLWQVTTGFALPRLTGPEPEGSAPPRLVDRWMLSRLAAVVPEVTAALGHFEFSVYAQSLYDLFWRDFCDWYIEAIKPTIATDRRQRAVLAHALETILRLLHPATPFVTEAIWERWRHVATGPIAGVDLGPSRRGGLLCTAGWPAISPSLRDESAEREFDRLRALISAVREVRAQHQVPPKRRIVLHAPAALTAEASRGGGLVETLAGLEALTTDAPDGPAVEFDFGGLPCRLSRLTDRIDADAERRRWDRARAEAQKAVATLEARLANPGYTDKAPPAMVKQTREQLDRARADLASAEASLARLGS